MTQSPSHRYQSFMERRRHDSTLSGQFSHAAAFELDDFQNRANDALESGANVLVAAPTGAGKTVVADFAVFLARHQGVKAFYTTPIKALSNQKYHDLCALYGVDSVGLLTGDTAVNPDADIVVMTTEVLRNMLYERSSSLDSLGYVILDEVHYLADRFRGPVWEEVIIHLPPRVRIIALSATVSNVEDFSGWISSVRGDTTLIVSEHRPVPLEQHVLVQQDDSHEPELIDLYRRNGSGKETSALNPWLPRRLEQLDRRAEKNLRPSHKRHGKLHSQQSGTRTRLSRHTPRRWAVIDELDFLDMLPGIYFIFSRAGCDKAVEQCLSAGLCLTTDDEARRIRDIVDDMVDGQLSDDDLKALHFARFRFALEEGFAPHHAGMIALFRQIVERLFEMGLVRMVFATETLALGVNMPARCVVIEKLEKYDGTGHVPLTPGEFTQLTGRAGRRGVDSIGHAVVVDHPDFTPAIMSSLSSARVYPIHSSFRPTFNMAVNLLNHSNYSTARSTLDHCFAQWEANKSSVDLEARIDQLDAAVASYEKAFACTMGDFREYMTIRRDLSLAQKNGRRELKERVFDTDQERSHAFMALDARIDDLRARERNHPCRRCPDLARHLTWGHRWVRESRELDRVRDAYRNRTGSVARGFDHICDVLKVLGYLRTEDHGGEPAIHLTPKGDMLRRLYSERDLLLGELLSRGVFDGLGHRELASVVSSLVYEARRGGEDVLPGHFPGGPRGRIALTAEVVDDVWQEVDDLCQSHGLESTSTPNFSICDVVYAWADGAPLAEVLADSDITGGDFVRVMKRLSDLLGQMLEACAVPRLNMTLDPRIVRRARDEVNRGVVAYSGVD